MTSQSDSSPPKLPGLGLAIGVFLGNLLFISILKEDVVRGLVAGTLAGLLVLGIYQIGRLRKGR